MDNKCLRLEAFLQDQGARLHPGINIAESEASGLHWHAKEDIESGCTIISVPHSMTLSYLNALVDEDWPVFKNYRRLFKPDFEVETITFFYLMIQYSSREISFWEPYLDALPAPEKEHTQPLFYEDEADIAWLVDTDVWHTNLNRTKRYREMYDEGKRVLQQAGCEMSWCTWHMFKWAAATFTSRSFASRSLRPHDSKYWAAYRHVKGGRSQTVLIDMSHASASDFPVLFPGLDIGNHSNDAKIDYIFDSGQFDIKTNTPTRAGDEVFNNYGPKSNDELLLGYGFCIPQNPYNTVSLMLRPPPERLQDQLRAVHPGYFGSLERDGHSEWESEKATFQLAKPGGIEKAEDVFKYLPEALLELLTYVLRHERGYTFTLIEQPREYLTAGDDRRCLPHIANILIQSLLGKLSKLQVSSKTLPESSQNARQRQAAIYRNDLRDTMILVITPLQVYLKSLVAPIPPAVLRGCCLLRLETFIQLCKDCNVLPPAFMTGIEANANTDDLEQLIHAGWEQDIWILLCTALSITPEFEEWLLPSCFEKSPPYMNLDERYLADRATEIEEDSTHPAHDLLQLVRTAAATCAGIWSSPLWNVARIAEQAKRLEFEAFTVMCPRNEYGDDGDARMCVYMSGDVAAKR